MFNKNLAFSLLELLTVAAILMVLSIVAIPAYQNYMIGSKVAIMWHQANPAKIALESDFIKNGTNPTTITQNSGTRTYTSTNLNWLSCVTVQNGVVSVVGNSSNFSGKDIWISWEPDVTDNILTWKCSHSADATPYVQESCSEFSCSTYGAWSAPSVVSTEEVWYTGSLTAADVQRLYADNCFENNLWQSCSDCFSFTDTDVTNRYIDISVAQQTINYTGGLLGESDWSGDTTWTYDYNYTQATQICYEITRTKTDCATMPAASHNSDGGC